MKYAVFAAGLMILSATALASGKDRGGGSRVFVDGKWELADIFIDTRVGEPLTLSPEMSEYLGGIESILRGYGFYPTRLFDQITGPEAEFRYVDQLPCKDDPIHLSDTQIPQDLFGCTKNGITYFIKEKLESLSFESQALAFIHERMHAAGGGYLHEDIAMGVKAIATMVKIKKEQNAGQFRKLTPPEYKSLQWTIDTGSTRLSHTFNMGGSTRYRVIANGGGFGYVFMDPAEVDATSFVGIGSRLGSSASAKGGSIVSDSLIEESRLEGARIEDSEISSSTVIQSRVVGSIITGTVVDNSDLIERCELTYTQVSRGARCKDSKITFLYRPMYAPNRWFRLGEGSLLVRSEIQIVRLYESFSAQFILGNGTGVFGLKVKNVPDVVLTFDSPGIPLNFWGSGCEIRSAVPKVIRTAEDLQKALVCEGQP